MSKNQIALSQMVDTFGYKISETFLSRKYLQSENRARVIFILQLTHFSPMVDLWFSDVFRGYRYVTLD